MILFYKHQSSNAFEPICPHITKQDCIKARSLSQSQTSNTSSPTPSICSRVHFRPLIRPHTDVTLGHCSYLNTCYSEPTYALSPSFSSSNVPRAPGAPPLPSGLGAGGRGKERAPCRYLHFEVDWDGGDGETVKPKHVVKKKLNKLGIGLGPSRKGTTLVSAFTTFD